MKKQQKKATIYFRYTMMIIGASMAAASIDLFLVPNKIIDGGVIGISLLLNNITGINFGILILLINLPFLFTGYKHIGKSFFISSLFSIIFLAIVEKLLLNVPAVTSEPLLATVFGGIL